MVGIDGCHLISKHLPSDWKELLIQLGLLLTLGLRLELKLALKQVLRLEFKQELQLEFWQVFTQELI